MTHTDAQLYTATVTPFNADGSLNIKAVDAFHQWLFDQGVDGVFAAGTTGEFTALDDDERITVIASALNVFGSDRVIAHTGASSFYQARRLTQMALNEGATRFAAMTPYFNPAGHEALVSYYAGLKELIGDGELYGYHFPARSATVMTPDEHEDIVTRAGLTGTKVSGLSASDTLQYKTSIPGFRLFTGSDATFADVISGGGYGAVSGISSAFPQIFVALRDAIRAGDKEATETYRKQADTAIASVGGADFGLLKYALELQGIAAGSLRIALDEADQEARDRVESIVMSFANMDG